jgi:hypothetical protein
VKSSDFARFTTRGLPGGRIEITCTRCSPEPRSAAVLPPPRQLGGDDLALSDQLEWALAHKCRLKPPARVRLAELVCA